MHNANTSARIGPVATPPARPSRRPRLSLLAALIALVPAALAQQNQPLSPDRATFFTEPNYRGESLVIEAGASVEDLARLLRPNGLPWVNAISSVRLDGEARAVVHASPGFGGDTLEITRNLPDLYAEPRGRFTGATWDRAIASITVTSPQRAVVTEPAPPPATMPIEGPTTVIVVSAPPPPPRAVVVAPPTRPHLDLRTADILIERAYREVLDRPADPEGLRTYRHRLLREGWTERQVIEQLQRSDEARSVNPEAAIAKAYREVLGRDPDANGLATYRARWRQGWTQGRIREDLRRSPEGREVHIRQTITRVYREVLGRDPDPAGYATYERLMRERGYTERDLRAALMNGEEYRQKRRGRGK